MPSALVAPPAEQRNRTSGSPAYPFAMRSAGPQIVSWRVPTERVSGSGPSTPIPGQTWLMTPSSSLPSGFRTTGSRAPLELISIVIASGAMLRQRPQPMHSPASTMASIERAALFNPVLPDLVDSIPGLPNTRFALRRQSHRHQAAAKIGSSHDDVTQNRAQIFGRLGGDGPDATPGARRGHEPDPHRRALRPLGTLRGGGLGCLLGRRADRHRSHERA